MSGLVLQKKAVEMAIILNAAVANIRLYPPTSDMIGASIGRLDAALNAILGEVDSVVFAESEKSLLISGQALNEKDQQKPQVMAFLELLRNTGIKSITFEKGVDKRELLALLEIVAAKPEKIKTAGGLQQIAAEKKLSHIFLDQKVYIAMDKNQKVVPSASASDKTDIPAEAPTLELSGMDRPAGIERRRTGRPNDLKNSGPDESEPPDHPKIGIPDYKDKLGSILKGETSPFTDPPVMQSLPGTIDQLLEKEKKNVAEALMEKLARGLLDVDPAVRDPVSETLAAVISRLKSARRWDTLGVLSRKLAGWLSRETLSKPVFEQACKQLQSLLDGFIQNRQLDECIPILKIFRAIECGQIKRDEAAQQISASILIEVAGGGALNALVQEVQTGGTNQKDQAVACLGLLGPKAVERLLNLLQESPEKTVQASILPVLTEMGPEAASHLANLTEQDLPAETMRHLVAVLGKVGSEEHLDSLLPLVAHRDIRVQREALNSFFNIGGKVRGERLLSLLPTVDDQLKPVIVAMLGALKHHEAVPILLEMLEAKSIIASKSKNELTEKICAALGKIGATEAIPALTAIVESKSLFKLKAYSDSVQAAAQDALSRIRG